MHNLTYAELFAGAGGMSIGLEAAGWHCVAHAEIEPHARAVLRKRWPDVPLLGDVTKIDGAQFKGITMLTGGSPCQDLSIAGKRSGMTEGSGTRSSLFFEQIRIWRESEAPLLLWENVMGAFSSNGGKDFAAVLESIVGASVAVPTRDGSAGWSGAGRVSGPAGVAIWRALDLQHFGWNGRTTPQRRRRVFVLGVRAGTLGESELLSLVHGLLGDSAASREAREGATPDAGRSVAGGDALAVNISNGVASVDGVMGTLGSRSGGQEVGNQTRGVVLTYDARGNGDGAVVNTLAGGGKGPLLSEDKSMTLGTTNDQVVFPAARMVAFGEYVEDGTASAIKARDHKDATDLVYSTGHPRRLMPVECERLMGWPRDWTAVGIDEQGREYALKDTPRYKLCGNGAGAPKLAWLGWQVRTALDISKPALYSSCTPQHGAP